LSRNTRVPQGKKVGDSVYRKGFVNSEIVRLLHMTEIVHFQRYVKGSSGRGYGDVGCGKECEGVESEGFRGRLDTNGVKEPLLFLLYYSLSSPLSCSPSSPLPSPALPPLPSPSPLQAAGTSLFPLAGLYM